MNPPIVCCKVFVQQLPALLTFELRLYRLVKFGSRHNVGFVAHCWIVRSPLAVQWRLVGFAIGRDSRRKEAHEHNKVHRVIDCAKLFGCYGNPFGAWSYELAFLCSAFLCGLRVILLAFFS